MNLLPTLVCLLQGLIELTNAKCRFSPRDIFCEGVDSEILIRGFYEHLREENMVEMNSIKITGGNWTTIHHFPTLSISGRNCTVTSLAINDASIEKIDEYAFDDLRSLRSLDLSHNQLETIPFFNLPTLEKLNLASNKIAHFNGIGTSPLSHLDMSNNRIRCLDFRNVRRMRVLDFSANKLESLMWSGYISYNQVLTSINLSSNKITEFKESQYVLNFRSLDLSFNNLSILQLSEEKRHLNVSNCNISHFKAYGVFPVEEVDFSQCQLGTISRNFHVTGKLKIQAGKDVNLTDIVSSMIDKISYNGILDLSYSSISNIPAGTFSGFWHQSLNLSHINVNELNSFIFKSSDMNILDLSHSHIKVLRPGVFTGLTSNAINLTFNEISDTKNVFFEVKVQTIDLSFNALRSIRNNSFENCDILHTIILSNCLIDKIEPHAFIRLEKLGILDLSNNKLLILERNTFHDLLMVELKLGGNKITTIRSKAFSDLSRLRSLNLSSIHLRNLETSAFFNLTQIESIDLSHNDINVIPSELIVNTPKMGTIDLSHNDINVIPPQLFVNTSMLETIDFTYNNISSINKFSNRLQINKLSLSVNGTLTSNKVSKLNIRNFTLENSRIETLEADCFHGMYDLEELRFENSDVYFVESGSLNDLYTLYYLDSQNLFRHVKHIEKDTFRDLRSLKMLNLSGLSIQTIEPNSFSGLSNIQKMLLSRNDLDRLIDDTFAGLSTLKVLDLSFNHIGEIENVLNPLENLEELYLQYNSMSRIEPNHFKEMHNLKKLRLDYNEIAHLSPDSFSGLQNLQELHLGSNNLTGWTPGVFQHLSNLRVLNLSRNELKILSAGVFSNLVSVVVLDLTDTSLYNLDEPGVFFSMRKLQQLFLDGNHLGTFAYERLLITLKNIVYIGISDNKWYCDEAKIPVYLGNNIEGVGCCDQMF